jgi:hypothetical protein
MDSSNALAIVRISPVHAIKQFDCGDDDLNDFLLNNSIDQFNQLLNVTYLIEDEAANKTVAFFSLLNDKIGISESKSKSFWNKHVGKNIPHIKRRSSYPAMKIGRLAVHNDFQKMGWGRKILDYLKILFITNNRTGCRFISVDAYSKSLDFYLKNEFEFLTDKDENKDTRLMYFDLSALSKQIASS